MAVSGNRRAAAYTEIRNRILNAEYEPGAALSEYQIAASLNVSRTPVREALKQLEQEGLVRSLPQRGVFVTDITVSDIDEIYQIREQLETFAARIAAVEMSDAEIDELRSEILAAQAEPSDSIASAFHVDIHLHAAIVTVTRNRRLAQILTMLGDQVHRIRALSPRTRGRLRAALDEHLEIVEAIAARDPSAAADAMASHLRAARENAIRLLRPTL
jgi:DNA-binding GntR family transcriptional regulator